MFVPLIQWLLNVVDWRMTLVVLGLINLFLCVPLYLGVIDPRLVGAVRPGVRPDAQYADTELRCQ